MDKILFLLGVLAFIIITCEIDEETRQKARNIISRKN